MIKRTACALSACGLLAIAGYEGYSAVAYQPLEGDVPTIGFGSTENVKMGDTITVNDALIRLNRDVGSAESAIAKCVKVPLSQGEYDAFTSLAFNIGTGKFCDSTLVKLLNEEKYDEACSQIKRWVYYKGKVEKGLKNRRDNEYEMCMRGK